MSRRRWWIAGTLCLSTILNYVNRQTFSVLAPELAKTFHFSHSDLSSIFGAFQLSYALTWLVGGLALDLTGTRVGLAVAVVWWSVGSMATSFAIQSRRLPHFVSCWGSGKA
jgi:MFS transporter, ACS family, aldohexuronate transporter